jgi:hypothetical protein
MLGERGLRVLGILAGIIVVTSVASLGRNGSQNASSVANEQAGAPAGAPSDTAVESAAPEQSAGGSSRSGGPSAGNFATGAQGHLTPSQARTLDFGLKTQGVTATQVKVGFSGNFDNCGDTAGLVAQFGPGVVGDPEKSINTFARYINDHGGIEGRRYKPILVQDGGSGCPERNLPAAVKMADEEKVFAAAPGLHVESDYIVSRKIPVWGGRDDPASLRKYGPNGYALLEPIEQTLEAWASFGKYYLKTDNGPNKACLIRIESGASGNWDIPQKLLVQKMARYGLKFIDIYVFKDDASTAQEQSTAIAIRERDKGCQHVYFMAGNPVGLVFITDAATHNRWFPKRWTWTGYTALVDDDNISKLMDQVQWENSVGLTYRIPSGEHPKAGNCRKIYEQYNGNDGQGDSASVKIACTAVLSTAEIMRRGLRLTGRLDANSFVIGADAIRNDFYWDAHVPMEYRIPGVNGPFKTRAFSHYTVADWSSARSAYEFPKYPCYYRVFKPNGGGCEDLRSMYR